VVGDTADEDAGAIWPSENVTTGNNPIAARFKFVGKVPVAKLLQQTTASLDMAGTDLAAVERCLNTVISKSFDPEVYRHATDKFFVKKARKTLYREQNKVQYPSQSLEIMRGYYYTIKPGMGCLLMNFNVATSAFFRPILVSEFLADNETFPSMEDRKALLSKLRVYVDPKHSQERLRKFGARIKSIHSIGDNNNPTRNIEDLSFFEKVKGADGKPTKNAQGKYIFRTTPTSVTDHIRNSFGLTAMTGRKAVNVGTDDEPVWYAQEHLRIVPYQLYKRPVPEHLTSSMVNQAALDPDVARTLIEREGLVHLGFNDMKDEKVKFRNNVPLSLYPTMMRVEAGKMPFPSVEYRWNQYHSEKTSKSKLSFGQSVWNIEDDHRFHEPKIKSLRYYVIHQLENRHISPTITNFETELINQLDRKCGLASNQVVRVNPGDNAAVIGPGQNLESKVQHAVASKADLVVLMLSLPDRHMYANFKKLADKHFGIRSLCIAKPSQIGILGTNTATKYMSNITQKINIKFGGINASVEYISEALGKKTLILGADVIHPGSGAYENSPSIACIVGSVDHQAGRFLGSARLQSKDKTDREVSHYMEVSLQKLLTRL
jgi:eukaryotic translation initiation factor 2C